MANEVKSIKPIEIDYNRPTSEFIGNIQEFGGELAKLADILNNLFSLVKDITKENTGDGNKDTTTTSTDSDVDEEFVKILQQLESDYKAGTADIRIEVTGDIKYGKAIFSTENPNTKKLYKLLSDVISQYQKTKYYKFITVYTGSIYVMYKLEELFLSKNKSLNYFKNIDQLIQYMQNIYDFADKPDKEPENIASNFISHDEELNEEIEEITDSTYNIKMLDPDGYKNIVTASNQVYENDNLVTVNNKTYRSPDPKVALNAFVNFINNLTDNNYNAIVESQTDIERIVYSVTRECTYKNMPGVFSAFNKYYGNVDGVLNAALRLLKFARINNNNRLIDEILNSDISQRLNNYTQNLDSIILEEYTLDSTIGEQQYQRLYQRLISGIENINPNWKTGDNNLLSASKLNNAHINTLLKALSLVNETSSLTALNPINDEAYLALANSFKDSDPLTTLSKSFPELNLKY